MADYLVAGDNKSSNFSCPLTLVSNGSNDVSCTITLSPCINTNLNSVWVCLNNNPNTVIATKSTNTIFNVTIPKTWFNNNNNVATIQVDTYDKNNVYLPGTFKHSIPLYNNNGKYKNEVSDFAYPSGVLPGGTCIINILPPIDYLGNALDENNYIYEVVVNCFGAVADNKVMTSTANVGRYSFIVPSEAAASCIEIKVTTKNKKTGNKLGTVSHSIPLGQSQSDIKQKLNKPKIILPENYDLTITEGVNVKIKGTSENINDYMIIYARKDCDVSEAVSKYTSTSGYYAAPKSELRQRLLDNAKGNLNYYILKCFDDYNTTFVSKDENDPTTFNIKTPGTNDYENIDDFYAIQWFKANPSDLLMLYVIERKWIEEKRTESVIEYTSNFVTRGQVNVTNWKCHHCDLADYRWWSVSAPWNPYGQINLNNLKTYFNQYKAENIQLEFTVNLNQSVPYPPDITFNKTKARSTVNCATPITNGPAKTYTYSIPVAYVQSLINEGKSIMYMHTHYGRNASKVNSAQYLNGYVTIKAAETQLKDVITGGVSYYIYSDSEDYIKDVTKIPESSFTPYIVLPPAVKPLQLKLKNITTKQAIVSYKNPLYSQGDKIAVPAYTKLGDSIKYNVEYGDNIKDLSDLNTEDKTLYLNNNEKRLITYEKKLSIPKSSLKAITDSSSNNIFIDLKIDSVDSKPLNFKNILSSDIKMQLMFSKNGSNKTRAIDISAASLELKNKQYHIEKMQLNKNFILDGNYDTIHLLYNSDEYDNGKAFITTDWKMMTAEDKYSPEIGWRKIGSRFGSCEFTRETFEIAKYKLNYENYRIRLCLEGLSASETLYSAPSVEVTHYKGVTRLTPLNSGKIAIGADIIYEIPHELFDYTYDDILKFSIKPANPYPTNLGDISFTDAYIEVIGMEAMDQVPDKYSRGFNATVEFYGEKKQTSSSSSSYTDINPVEAVDIIMCCFDSKKQLINKSESKYRDIFNGRELIYYSDRKWHSFVNGKYAYSPKFKEEYDMVFSIPDNTEYMFFIAFTYGNWMNNPSIYSMSNILTEGSINQEMGLFFVSPKTTYDNEKNIYYANCDINNPVIELRLNSEQSNSIQVVPDINDSFNLAEDPFDLDKWHAKPIIYSCNKKFGYEQPIFEVKDLYVQNNVVSSTQPLYNSIEYYSQWKNLYGTEALGFKESDLGVDAVDINSEYTIFEDEGDKFISNKAVPYIELPAELANYDRSKITLFADSDFGVGNVIIQEKYVTETYTENYTISKYRSGCWGVKTLWTKKIMEAFEDVASIEDIKIEWGMKLNLDHKHPTEGRRGPILVEDLWVDSSQSYNYNPASKFPDECSGDKIKDYGGHDIWHKNYGDYIYFEITNPRIKRLFLECNCHRRRHDAIKFEDFQYDWCWDTTVKVKYTVTRKVKGDGTPLYKKQPLGSEHYGSQTWVAGWAMYQMPKFKYSNIEYVKAPTASDPTFIAKYDVRLSPVIFYYKNNPVTGDALGNIYKYTWGDNPDAYMKWETITVQGRVPYTHTRTHYYIAYEEPNTVYDTFIFDIDKDGVITPR